MFGFIKEIFLIGSLFLSSLVGTAPLSCISMINQACKVRPEIINVNSNEPVFYPFSIKTSKCSGSCNNINDPYAKISVPEVIKNLNVKVFNLMSRTNETRHIKRESWKTQKHWNDDKCRCEYKELIDKGACDRGYIWNRSNCGCKCDKSCDVGEYLDYRICKWRKRLVDKLVEESNEIVEEVKIVGENEDKCSSCIL